MKLSLRLSTALENALPDLCLWDICCDHGLLGMHALRSQKFPQVHFVDQVPHLMNSLHETVTARWKSAERSLSQQAFFHTTAAEDLRMTLNGTICVLGVGAQKIEIFLKAWKNSGLLSAERLILGPHKDETWFLEKIIPGLENYRLQKQIDLCERGRKRTLFILDRWTS